jgi:hypothetical protein
MNKDGGLKGIARILCTVALMIAAGFISGCGGYDVGPDPLPWSQPADPGPLSSAK